MSSALNDHSSAASLILHLPDGLRNSAEAKAAAKAMAAQTWACDESAFELLFEPRIFVPKTVLVEGVPVSSYQTLKANAVKKTKYRLWMSCFIAITIALSWGALIWHGQKNLMASKKLLNDSHVKLKSWTELESSKNSIRSKQDAAWNTLKPLLEVDLNPVFNLLETIKLPQVRLRSLDIDSTTRNTVLIYELPNMSQIGELQKILSQDTNELSCQLISIQSANPLVNAQWRCTF